jgi:CRISPR/Cas system-associated exonuclease Cas4 (RecB family)
MTTGYIRKSMLESFEFCPRQFYHQFIELVDKPANQKMLIGTRFHEFAERFFDYAMVLDPQDWDELIPVLEFNSEEIAMAQWFLSFQRSRLTKLMKEGRENEFVPMYRELFMICDRVQVKSTLDGAEWVSKREQTVRLIEYKTGSKMNTESAIRQLAFYAVLWELCGNPGTITELQLINPRLQAIFTAELTPEMKKAALLRVAKLRAAIDKNDYPYKCTDGKYAACKMCTMEELPKLFPDDGLERFSDIYDD